MYQLGECCYYGIGTEKNEIKAFELYETAADKGHIDSMYQLGECYYYGIGTEKNEIKALESYKEAADKGHINAKTILAYAYNNYLAHSHV
jgi:TPR repeat protein